MRRVQCQLPGHSWQRDLPELPLRGATRQLPNQLRRLRQRRDERLRNLSSDGLGPLWLVRSKLRWRRAVHERNVRNCCRDSRPRCRRRLHQRYLFQQRQSVLGDGRQYRSALHRSSAAKPARGFFSEAHSKARASTALGEVGGAQRPKAASTDGCHRRAATNSEGAGAERKGFEPLAWMPPPSSARPFGAARFLPPPNSVLALRAARGMEGGRRGVHGSSVADDTRE